MVGIQADGQVVVVGQRECERCTYPDVSRQESGVVTLVVGHLGTDIGQIETQRPLALVTSDDGVGGEEARKVGGKGRRACGLTCVHLATVTQVTVDVAQGYTHREFLAQLAAIAHIDRHLKRVDGTQGSFTLGEAHLSQRKVAQRGADCLVVASSNLIVTGQIRQIDVVDKFAQPRGVGQ